MPSQHLSVLETESGDTLMHSVRRNPSLPTHPGHLSAADSTEVVPCFSCFPVRNQDR